MGRVEISADQEMQPHVQQQPHGYPPQQYPPPQAQQPTQYSQNLAGGYVDHYAPPSYPPPSPQPDPVKPVQFPPMAPSVQAQCQPYVMDANAYSHQPPVIYAQPGMKQNVVQGFPHQGGAPMGVAMGSGENWTTGLFDCMDDPSNALITCAFPCITFGQIAEILERGNTTCATNGLIYGVILALIYAPCLVSCSYRSRMRSRFNLPEAPAPDWITHCIFEHCALCQEYRELKNRGIDPAIGWEANVARNPSLAQQQAAVTMIPPMGQRMMG